MSKKPKCPKCMGRGLIVGLGGNNRWCECLAGREFVTEINKARADMGKTPMVEAAKPSGPTHH